MNSILNWNDSLFAIFEAKLTFSARAFLLFFLARLTIFCTEDLTFLLLI